MRTTNRQEDLAAQADDWGDSLLRGVINNMDIIAVTDDLAIVCVTVPLRKLRQLELWGADAEDLECDGLW